MIVFKMSVDSRSINIDLCGLVYIKTNIWIKIAGAIITVKSEAVTMTKVLSDNYSQANTAV